MEHTYKLYDVYDGVELLAKTTALDVIGHICLQRDYDTDGEWEPMLTIEGTHDTPITGWHYTESGHIKLPKGV